MIESQYYQNKTNIHAVRADNRLRRRMSGAEGRWRLGNEREQRERERAERERKRERERERERERDRGGERESH